MQALLDAHDEIICYTIVTRQALLDAHDDIIERRFVPVKEEEVRPQLFQSVSTNLTDLEDNVRLVGIMKSDEPLVRTSCSLVF